MKSIGKLERGTIAKQGVAPKLNIKKIGIVSRDYRCKFPNGRRDFSFALPKVLKLLEGKGCDAVSFSLYSIIPQESHNLRNTLNRLQLKRIRAIFLEEFGDRPKRRPQQKQRKNKRFVVYHYSKARWREYELLQEFGTLADISHNEMVKFVSDEMPKRILGNCCVVLCGESNGVKYFKLDKKVKDTFGLRAAIPRETNIILNPVHDRMTRFEMKLKRQFLSEKSRWVISVWNKGKEDKNARARDGSGPAWTVFHNGVSNDVDLLPNALGIEIGILDVEKA
jgi:hypothetical protein